MGIRLICIHVTVHAKRGYSNVKCHNLHKFQFIFGICSKNCANKLKHLSPDWNNVNSHDSGGHFEKSTFKNSCC